MLSANEPLSFVVLSFPLVITASGGFFHLNGKCLWSSCNISELCTVMAESFTGLLLRTERLRCHLAGICAVTVLARLTEPEHSHWAVGLMGLEYDLSAMSNCLRAV